MQFVYVDFENLNNLNKLEKINGKYLFFIGSSQTKINSSLILSTNEIAVQWYEIEGSGKNALDFHIAYYIAKNDEDKNNEHFILSKDTGFDPLINHLNKKGIKIKRIITLDEINKEIKKENGTYQKVIANLLKINKTQRPQSVKKISAHIATLLKSSDEKEINDIIEELFRQGFISTSNGTRIKYMK